MPFSKEMILGSSGNQGSAGFYPYQIEHSCRFTLTHADRLTRTPGSAGNRRTNTFSMWIKRANPLETYQTVFLQSDDAGTVNRTSSINFQTEDNGSGNLGRMYSAINGGLEASLYPVGRFRDTTSWYHLVLRTDTTQATEANRQRIYINGVQQTLESSPSYPGQNFETGYCNTTELVIGSNANANSDYPFSGYLAEVILADGTSYGPDQFGETKSGVWIPKDPSGTTFGTTGFHLKFDDSSSLGADSSGNGNNFSVNSIGADHQEIQIPTNGTG